MNLHTTATRPTSALSLAVLGTMAPIVESNPTKVRAMADALDWFGHYAMQDGRATMAARKFARAQVLRTFASRMDYYAGLPDLFADDGGVPSPCEDQDGVCACGTH